MITEMLRRSLETTVGITCEVQIDDAGGDVEHLQLSRFDWFM
jgi:hypothetical protein